MIKFSNNLRTTLAADVTNVATTISVTSVATFPTLNTGDTLYLTLSDLSETVSEIVICTAISGTELTVLRAQEGTTAQTWTAANEIRVTGRLTAGLLDSLRNSLVPVGGTIDDLGDVNTSTAVDGQILTWNNAAGEWQPQDFVIDSVGSTNNVDVRSYNSTQNQTSFAVIYDGTKSTVEVFVNGIKIADTEYTATSGNSVVFNTGRNADDIIDLVGYSGAAIAISTLEDVDTSNLSPVDGQSLVWNNTSGIWERGTAAGTAVGLIDGIVKGDGLGTISAAVADVDYLAATPNMAAFRDAFTFPTVDSTSGYVLATDGNGNLSFVVQSGGSGASGTISTVDMHSYTAVSSQTSFAVAYDSTDSTVDVYVNGVKIAASEYTATSGINIVFNTGRTAGDVVDVVGYSKAAVSIDNLTDVDTTTSAPTNQQVLGWSTANGQWEPLTVVVNETDPVFTAWDKSTGISITESQISDFGSYLTTDSAQALHATDALSIVGNTLYLNKADGTNETIDLSLYLDDTNLARITSGIYNADTQELIFTRDDASTFAVDASMFFDDTNLVTSVAGKTGVVTLTKADISDFNDADYATATQGATADTAVQPGDNVSGLTNDAGYLTAETSHADVLVDGDFASAGFMKTDGSGNYSVVTDAYTLPTASDTELGGIKVGAGLTITSGVLSVNSGGTADSVEWTGVLNTPTTLSGYGITDGQPLDGDLSAIAGLAGTSGFLKKTAADTWALDTNTYLTSYTETNDLSSAVTWANVPDANITQTSVTQHQAALSITESQISDLGSYLTTVALNDVSDVTLTTPASGEVLKYDGSNWVNSTDAGGISLTDLSITTNAAGTAALSYNNITGEFSYTPPDLSGYSTFDGAYSSLTGTPTIPTALTDLGITDGTVNQVLTTDGNGTFSFQDAGGGTTINSIDDINDVDTTTTAPDNGQALIWDGTNWVPGTVAAPGTSTSLASDIRSYTLTGTQDTFNVNYDIATEAVTVFLNGIKLDPSTYTATTGTSITLNTAAVVGDIVDIVGYIKGIFAGGTNTRTATGDGTTVSYAVTSGASVDDVFVTLNGIVQTPTTDYTISGAELTFTTAPVNGDLIQIREVATLATAPGLSTGAAIAMAIVFGG